jgi:hypothetical protein
MRYLTILLSLAIVAAGADISGEWKLSYSTSNKLKREAILKLKIDGGQVTGVLSSDRGSAPIAEGRLDGSALSFSVIRKGNGDEVRIVYKGTVEGDSMKLMMQYGGRDAVAITATR